MKTKLLTVLSLLFIFTLAAAAAVFAYAGTDSAANSATSSSKTQKRIFTRNAAHRDPALRIKDDSSCCNKADCCKDGKCSMDDCCKDGKCSTSGCCKDGKCSMQNGSAGSGGACCKDKDSCPGKKNPDAKTTGDAKMSKVNFVGGDDKEQNRNNCCQPGGSSCRRKN